MYMALLAQVSMFIKKAIVIAFYSLSRIDS